jgi:hypothetical protein
MRREKRGWARKVAASRSPHTREDWHIQMHINLRRLAALQERRFPSNWFRAPDPHGPPSVVTPRKGHAPPRCSTEVRLYGKHAGTIVGDGVGRTPKDASDPPGTDTVLRIYCPGPWISQSKLGHGVLDGVMQFIRPNATEWSAWWM